MSLATAIAGAVAVAKRATATLQPEVIIRAWIDQDGEGAAVYAAPVVYHAIVEQKVQPRYTKAGVLVLTKATVTFLEPLPPNGAAGRVEPVDSRDLLTLPDGTTGPIVMVDGMVNADTNAPFMTQVWIGQ